MRPHTAHPATPSASPAEVCVRTLGRACSELSDSRSRTVAHTLTRVLSGHGLARGTLSLFIVITCLGCDRTTGSTPAEFLGGVTSKAVSGGFKSSAVVIKTANEFSSRDTLSEAINALAEDKMPLAVERLSADAIVQYPNDDEFKIIHARALLDLGRTEVTKPVLSALMLNDQYRDEARFLSAIALLSELQRAGSEDPRALQRFVQASTLLYEVVQSNPKFQDRFPPKTHINQVRQGLVNYSKAVDLDALTLKDCGSEICVLAMLDVLKRLNKHSQVSSLLKAAHLQYPTSNSLWLSRAELHLTQNEPLVALEFINQVKSFETLTAEELLTYAAGQIAAAKQLKTPRIRPFARSYRALLVAQSKPEESVFKTLIPRVKKTIYGLLPTDAKTRSTQALSPAEKKAFEQLLKEAGLE